MVIHGQIVSLLKLQKNRNVQKLSFFSFNNQFFFKLAGQFVAFNFPKKTLKLKSKVSSFSSKLLGNDVFISDFFLNLNKLSWNSKFFVKSKDIVLNYLKRFFYYKFFFNKKVIFFKRNYLVFLRSVNAIWQVLINKYKSLNQGLQLKFFLKNGEKIWYFLIKDTYYFWDNSRKLWLKNQVNSYNYFFKNNLFLKESFSSKMSFSKYRAKIYNYKKNNLFFKYGVIFRWNKRIFTKRMISYFKYFKRRLFFIKWWHLIFHRILHITFPFIFMSRVLSRKLFLSINFFIFKSFFYRIKPNNIITIQNGVNFSFFQNVVVFNEFFSKLMSSVSSLKSFSIVSKFMDYTERDLKKNDYIYYNNAKRLFTSLFWNFLKGSQKKDLVYHHKFGYRNNVSNIILFFNFSILNNNRVYNYILDIKAKRLNSVAGFKKFFSYHNQVSNRNIDNYFYFSRFLFNNKFIYKKKKN